MKEKKCKVDSCCNMVISEFLIHAADVEGLCNGIDEQLVERTVYIIVLGPPKKKNVEC
jgi:phosphoribosylformimino-5-aminoimidazole carboxamide ribonucleotide (ProFAR) isomerase